MKERSDAAMNDRSARAQCEVHRDRSSSQGSVRLVLTVVQCIATRRLEFYGGSVLLTTITPSEPGSGDEVAEIYTSVLIELLEILEQGSNHQRIQILEGMRKRPDLSSPPSGAGLLAASGSCIGKT